MISTYYAVLATRIDPPEYQDEVLRHASFCAIALCDFARMDVEGVHAFSAFCAKCPEVLKVVAPKWTMVEVNGHASY